MLDALDALAPVLATGEAERARVQHAGQSAVPNDETPCPACRGGKTLRHLDGAVIACPRCGGSGFGGAVGQALARIARGDYDRWLEHVGRAGGCENPIRLAGEVTRVDARTGEVVESYRSADAPDGVIYLPCNNRRASVCPACSEVYRYDTYNLVAAGLRGGKGIPDTVGEHPCVFVTLTAPSFGAVHAHRADSAGKPLPCRPRRAKTLCPHGRATWCAKRHDDQADALGTPLCVACYDHHAAVVWNHFAPELWRYFRTYLPRERPG
jgi:hypothetical protein